MDYPKKNKLCSVVTKALKLLGVMVSGWTGSAAAAFFNVCWKWRSTSL